MVDSCPPLSNLNLINALFEVGEEKRSETLNQVNLVIYKNVCKKTCKCNKDKKLEEKLITVLATSNLSISKMFNPHLTAKFSIFDVKYIISLLGLKAFVF